MAYILRRIAQIFGVLRRLLNVWLGSAIYLVQNANTNASVQ